MEGTNIYIPQFFDSFRMMKLDSPKHPDSWKLENVESERTMTTHHMASEIDANTTENM